MGSKSNDRCCILCGFSAESEDGYVCEHCKSSKYGQKVEYENCALYNPKDGAVFGSCNFRHPDRAFENAIKKGMRHPEDWMYMYSDETRDYFKHIYHRGYRSYSFVSLIDRLVLAAKKEFETVCHN